MLLFYLALVDYLEILWWTGDIFITGFVDTWQFFPHYFNHFQLWSVRWFPCFCQDLQQYFQTKYFLMRYQLYLVIIGHCYAWVVCVCGKSMQNWPILIIFFNSNVAFFFASRQYILGHLYLFLTWYCYKFQLLFYFSCLNYAIV
jgi:hypothetical protein